MLRRAASAMRSTLNKYIATFRWLLQGRPAPAPPHVKRDILLRLARRHRRLKVFVETGTFYGDTIAFMRPQFDELHSIELDAKLHAKARERFAGDAAIHLWQGDSGDLMVRVLAAICKPAMFWLDGHYSGEGTARGVEDTPIYHELEHLSQHPLRDQHLVVIDDARLFDGNNGYPTLEALRTKAIKLGFSHMSLKDDMILFSAQPVP
jgi:hypothetical protein